MAKTLDQLISGLEKLETVDAVRRQNNSYALDEEGNITAFSLSGSALENLALDEKAARLEYLYLSRNKGLKEVEFKKTLTFSRLAHLNLSRCALAGNLAIPAGCEALRQIYLQENKLEEVNFDGPCPALELLDATKNQLKSFSLPGGFGALRYLYLGDNQLRKVDLGPDAGKLEILHLRNNGLRALPHETILSNSLQALYCAGNAPKDIPKVFLGNPDSYSSQSCLEEACVWFEDLRSNPNQPNKTIKLMLTGNGNAGKTSLLCALKNGRCEHDHDSTHGIEIEALPRPEVIYNAWDFGGQEVYHGTHRLFIGSEALQVILTDPETEEDARKFVPVKDRILDDDTHNHPIEYWYETAKELSPDSRFIIVQNKKDSFEEADEKVYQYSKDKARFVHLSAKTGTGVDELEFYLSKYAKELPDHGMLMPESWLKVRKYFLDNMLRAPEKTRKLITKQEFNQLCGDSQVRANTRDMLFRYLHHSGFLYYHKNLGENIIADQRWALDAIYQPLNRKKGHYKEFEEGWKGKVRVRRLFQVFDENPSARGGYSDEEKWLFLSFMESCGLCFQLNNRPSGEGRSESDIYVFPGFLPIEKPKEVSNFWSSRAQDVHILRYLLPWPNYFLIQSFITALGRKTETDNIWHGGIHVSTPEGWFKVELDYRQRAIMLHIEKKAMGKWLSSILEELKVKREGNSWEISTDGRHYQPFSLEAWQQQQKEKAFHPDEAAELEKESKSLSDQLPDIRQQYHEKTVILFVAANPNTSEKLGSQEKEHSKIVRAARSKCEVEGLFSASAVEMNNAISQWHPHILHFCGHADQEGIELHDSYKRTGRPLDIETLAKAFESIKQDFPQLNVVFLNACYTEQAAKAISRNKIYALGTADEIHSTNAIPFAEGFYFQYALTRDVEKSIRHGLRQVLMEREEDIKHLIHLFYNGNRIPI